MKQLLALALCVIVPSVLLARDSGYKVMYDGGSLPEMKNKTGMRMYIDSGKVRVVKDKTDIIVIPAASIVEVSYGQDVHRRVGTAIGLAMVSFGIGAFMLLAKSKKHFIGITWEVDGKKGGAAFQADKGDYRGLIAGLEGVSGKKAVNSDAMTVKN